MRRSALAAVLAATVGCVLLFCSTAAAEGTRATAVSVECASPVAVGQPSKCTATVSDIGPPTRSVPTGMVSFSSEPAGSFSATECELKPVSGEAASCSVEYTPTQVGIEPHKITAKYPGDLTHEKSTSAPFLVTVTKRLTSVSVECASPVAVGQPSKCTATVSDTSPPTRSTPTGVVSFSSEPAGSFSATECELKPVSGEAASCSVEYTPTQVGSGEHKITAKYLGDETHEKLTSEPVSVTVTRRLTSISVVCASPVAAAQPSKCTATVSDISPPARSVPTGNVSFGSEPVGGFSAGGECKLKAVVGKELEASSCTVEYTPALVGPGPHKITAKYPGDEAHAPIAGEGAVVVTTRSTSVSVSCGSAVVVGQSATCVATVKDTAAGSATAPTGTVSFSSNTGGGSFGLSASCALVALASPGEAGCLVQYTPGQVGSGTHTITAEYGGDPLHAKASGAGALTVGVATKPAPPAGGGPPPPVPTPSVPKCRLVVAERWVTKRTGKRHATKTQLPVLSVSYSCDQTAAVRIEGGVTIAASGSGRKKTKAKRIPFAPATSQAVAGQTAPAVVVALGSSVSKALSAHLHALATISFRVTDANGVGVATLKLTLVPLSTKHG